MGPSKGGDTHEMEGGVGEDGQREVLGTPFGGTEYHSGSKLLGRHPGCVAVEVGTHKCLDVISEALSRTASTDAGQENPISLDQRMWHAFS